MSWRTLNESDLTATLSAQEVEAFRRSADWSSDPVEALLTRTAEYVRGYLRQSGVAMSPTAATIPDGLISPACDYAAFDVLKRLPRDVARDRADARRAAVALFEAVAKGAYKVKPFGGDEDSGGGASPRFVTPRLILD